MVTANSVFAVCIKAICVFLVAICVFSYASHAERGPWQLIGRHPDTSGCNPSTDGTIIYSPSAVTIIDAVCVVWSFGSGASPNTIILRNGVQSDAGLGSKIEWCSGVIYALGSDNNYYAWNNSTQSYDFISVADPCGGVISYVLTVTNGTGDGSYTAGTVVSIVADAPASGYVFNAWTGAAVASASSASTTITMPAGNTTVTATYNMLPSGSVYYVSKSGNDSNPCAIARSTTPANQKLTISAGVACLSAGDTLLIHTGTYTDVLDTINSTLTTVSSGTSESPITISAYPGGLAASTIPGPRSGADVVTIQPPYGYHGILLATTAPSYLVFQDLVIDLVNSASLGDQAGGPPGVYMSTGASHNTFLHLEVHNGGAAGMMISHHDGDAVSQQILYCALHHNGQDQRYANNGYGIYGSTAGNIIDGNDIYDNHGYGIQFNGVDVSNNIIRNNRIHHNYPWDAGGGFGGTTGGGVTIQGDGQTVPVPTAVNVQIYNNLVYENGWGGGSTSGEGIQVFTWTKSTLVYNNTVYHNNGWGLHLEYYYQTFPPTIRNNLLYANVSGGIHDFGALDASTNTPIIDHNVTSNPSFIDAAGENFHTAVGTATDAGVTLAGVPTDFAGVARPIGGGYDAGAFEDH